jgi:hypothetical protein
LASVALQVGHSAVLLQVHLRLPLPALPMLLMHQTAG